MNRGMADDIGGGRAMAAPSKAMDKSQVITSTHSPLNSQNEKAADVAPPRVRSDFPETWLWADANVKLGTF
jgi:hypothetical protein